MIKYLIKSNKGIVALGFLFVLSFVGCKQIKEEKEPADVPQGVIIYEISYPYYNSNSIMGNMMPKEMKYTYKGHKFKIEVKKSIFSNTLIADEEKKTIIALLHLSSKKMACRLNEKEINAYLAEFPEMEYLHDEGVQDSIAGFGCQQSIALFKDHSREVELKYTDQIPLDDPNWCNPYSAIKGMLLQYEVKQYDLTMRFTAKELKDTTVSDSEFEIPDDYEMVDFKTFEEEMELIFNTLDDNV